MLLLLMSTLTILVGGESPPEILKDPSFLKLLNKHYARLHSPRTYWPYYSDTGSQKLRPQDDSYRLASDGISHNYASHPYASKSSIVKSVPQLTTESSSYYPSYSTSQDYWSPTSHGTWHANTTRSHGYRPYTGLSSIGGPSSQDTIESPSVYQYQQVRAPTRVYATVKKPPVYYTKGTQSVGKLKYKKNFYSPSGYKKTVYPRVHKPHTMHKYPTKKTVHPIYRRYYQSPYQQYLMSTGELLRYKLKKPSHADTHDYKVTEHTTEASPLTPVTRRYFTTERMDDSEGDRATTSEDYANYNYTYQTANSNLYENYEEVESTTSEPDENSYDEIATRGYYGDRIYMSSQVPMKNSEKTAAVRRFYVVRRTSDDDDIETIFE